MRPTRLELEGFASFREPTVVDLEDCDLFVLSGPTGAGKSSLIDAMTFALYGSVPRYDDRRLVAPVISQGMAEARVRLHFTVGGVGHTAVRVVRRTKNGGATTKEARLERWRGDDPGHADVVAGTADEVNQAIERLLGLSFEHFTTCIVLPQGAFQAFLHAKPKDRNDLLVELLDLDIYRRVGQLARERATAAEQRAELLARRIEGELATASTQERDAQQARLDAMAELIVHLSEAEPVLEEIRAEGRRQAEAAEQARKTAATLAELQVPSDVAELAARLAEARAAQERAGAEATAASQRVTAAEAAAADAGDVAALQQQQQRVAELAKVAEQVAEEAAALDADSQRATAAAQAVADAETAVEAATHALHTAERADLAATLGHELAVGDDCPVCARPLTEPVTTPPADQVAGARGQLTASEERLRDARNRKAAADTAMTRRQARIDSLHERRQSLSADIDRAGLLTDADVLAKSLAEAVKAQEALAAARRAERESVAAERSAGRAAAEAGAAIETAWQRFDSEWQRLARYEPPSPDRQDLAGSWQALARWASDRAPELVAAADAADREVEQTRQRWRAARADLEQTCRQAGLELPPDLGPTTDLKDLATTAREHARHRIDRLDALLAEATKAREEHAAAVTQQRVAKELGRHLHARRFEQWLLRRALQRLVAGATRILQELSNGAYSLGLDDNNNFQVTDHRNADEVRSARTLSGGETFLASLALALALAEHVADLAAQGAARLESLFLDEGFGTLDADMLDVVASALEELGSRGRMVGVITHVPALAERLPIRFDVRKVGAASTVARCDADEQAEGAP